MDELEIGGKKYLSSKRAAREHKYHIDYIGQLIRAGKVVGKKVGRAWYVEEKSLNTYLKQEAGEKAYSTLVREEPAVATEAPAATAVEEDAAESAPEEIKKEVSEIEAFEAAASVPVAKQPEPEPLSEFAAVEAAAPATTEESFEEEKEEEMVVLVTPQPEKTPTINIVHTVPKAQAAYGAPATFKKPSTLTYVEDNEPLLPVLDGRARRNADFVAVPLRKAIDASVEEEEEAVVPAEEENDAYVSDKPAKKTFGSRMKQGTVLVAVGVVALAIVAAASSMLAASVQVSDGKPASVSFTIK